MDIEPQLADVDGEHGLYLAPRILTLDATELPASIDGMHALLKDHIPATTVAFGQSPAGKAEGLVLRNSRRSVIAKARFEDYHRTLRRRANAK